MYEVPTQECNECHEHLNLHEFGFSPSRGTHNKKCKQCTKNRKKKWYKPDPNLSYSSWRKKENV